MKRAKTPYFQMNFGDRFLNLSDRGKKEIRDSALGHFGDEILPLIDPNDFAVLYSENGRGPANLQTLVAAYLIMNMEHMTADELSMRIDSDVAVQYALGTTSLHKQPFSRRNLFYFMAHLEEYQAETGIDLIEQCFKNTTSYFAKEMGFDHPGNCGRTKKRMDSFMVESNTERLPRTGIIYEVNQDALQLFAGLQGIAEIAPSLLHYLDDSDENAVIYHNKDGLEEKLRQLLKESKMILELLQDEEWHEFQEYKNLVRVISDQSYERWDGTLIPIPGSEIKGSSLQTPEDPDATARIKAGKVHVGQVANVTEAYGENGSLITEADITNNLHSDSSFMQEYIEAKPEEVEHEEQVVTDGAYYTIENAEQAESKGVVVIPTSLTGDETPELCSDFKMSEDGTKLDECPNQKVPFSQKYNPKTGKVDAKFSHADCDHCPFRNQCPGKDQRKAVKVTISTGIINRAELQQSIGTEQYKQFCRERNGVEAIPSIFRRKYHIDELRTRITERIRSRFFAICIAYNGQKHKKFLDMHRVKCAQF